MCVQCSAQLRGLRCADMIQCSFACASLLKLAKHCENSRETSSGYGGGIFFAAALAPSLSHHRPPTWTSRHSNKDPPHFPSSPFPFPISLPVHHSFLSTVSGFVPHRLDTCDSAVTHHPHPCNMYAEEGG